MKSVICALAMLACFSGCAAFQGEPSKVDLIADKLHCVANAVKPFEQYFTKEVIVDVLAGKMDPVEYLKGLKISPADLVTLVSDLEACDLGK